MLALRRPSTALAVTMLGAITVAGLASAASAGVPRSGAGDGAATILEYALASTPVYTLNTNNPQQLDQVAFTLSPAPSATSQIRAQVQNPGGAWYNCTAAGSNITCNTAAGMPASSLVANQLRVVVVN